MATDARSTSRDRLRAMPCQKEENERSEVKSTKTIRMSLSREQPPARVERAQQEQDYAASRSGHAGCRLFLFRCKRECGLFSPRFAANDSPVEDCDRYFLRKKGTKKSCGRRPRLSSFRSKRECGGLKTASAGDGGILHEHANMRTWANTPCSHVRAFGTRASRSRQPQPKSRVSSGSARCCGTPRDRPRSEARYTRCGPIRCTRSAKRR